MGTNKGNIVKPVESIISIIITLIVLVLFNRYSDRMAFALGGSACTPIFSREALDMFLPLWNAAWVLSIGKDGLLLYRRRRELGTEIYEIVISVLDIVILALLIRGPFIISDAMLALLAGHVPFIGGMVRIILPVAFGIGLVVTAVQTIVKTVRLIRESTRSLS